MACAVARGVCGWTGLIRRCVITRQLSDIWNSAETVTIENFEHIGDRHNQGKMSFSCCNIYEYSATSIACQEPLGMESTAIKKGQISGSSDTEKASPDQARLNLRKSKHSQGAWIPEDEDYNAWLQISLDQWNVLITAVATQGLEESSKWVTKYKLQYWRLKTKVQYYKDPQQSGPFKVIDRSLSFLLYSSFILNM